MCANAVPILLTAFSYPRESFKIETTMHLICMWLKLKWPQWNSLTTFYHIIYKLYLLSELGFSAKNNAWGEHELNFFQFIQKSRVCLLSMAAKNTNSMTRHAQNLIVTNWRIVLIRNEIAQIKMMEIKKGLLTHPPRSAILLKDDIPSDVKGSC